MFIIIYEDRGITACYPGRAQFKVLYKVRRTLSLEGLVSRILQEVTEINFWICITSTRSLSTSTHSVGVRKT